MLPRLILAAAALAALVPAPASAATVLKPLKPCYVVATEAQREYVVLEALSQSFTPFAPVDVFVDDIQQTFADPQPQAAFDGSLAGSVPAPYIDEGQRTFTVRVAERGNANNMGWVSAKVTRLSVSQTPARASTREKVRFRGSGFTTPGVVYAHYVFAGKSHKTVRIGRPAGDCGQFSIRRRQFP